MQFKTDFKTTYAGWKQAIEKNRQGSGTSCLSHNGTDALNKPENKQYHIKLILVPTVSTNLVTAFGK